MSPADFAAAFTFSIALVAMLFDCGVLAGSTAATLPAVAGGAAGELALPDVALSDLAMPV